MSGGLGNQLFQYATARALAERNGACLVLDRRSGFLRDRQYRREYALESFPISNLTASLPRQLQLWAFRAYCKFLSPKLTFKNTFFNRTYFVEIETLFYSELVLFPLEHEAWLIGYWQSAKYFNDCEEVLHVELMPPMPSSGKARDLSEIVQETVDSVALGVRMYEESRNPSDHGLNGRLKSLDDINDAIKKLQIQKPNARFFVFCTKRFQFLEELTLPPDTIFVTSDEGFSDASDSLWLLTRCKHHIFTNSSYYWWGAWLSHAVHKKEEQLIYAADNFINVDGLCDHWLRF